MNEAIEKAKELVDRALNTDDGSEAFSYLKDIEYLLAEALKEGIPAATAVECACEINREYNEGILSGKYDGVVFDPDYAARAIQSYAEAFHITQCKKWCMVGKKNS